MSDIHLALAIIICVLIVIYWKRRESSEPFTPVKISKTTGDLTR